MSARSLRESPLELYSSAAQDASDRIIRVYSTSFGLATRLLGTRHRAHVRNIYALVRIADELVDGVTAEAGLAAAERRAELDELEAETERAVDRGYSSNPVVHAFARTARESGIDVELTRPFFASMRTDLRGWADEEQSGATGTGKATPIGFDEAMHAEYVYGSAEVVGLMCLRVFLRDERPSSARRDRLERGARSLGAAFQNVNFLRDLADDTDRLARSYLSPDMVMSPDLQRRWIATIREQLADASGTLPLLPRDARLAVGCALRLFARLTDRLAAASLDELRQRRVRIGWAAKTRVVLLASMDLWKPNTP